MRLTRSDIILCLSGAVVTLLLLQPLPLDGMRRWPALARDLIDFCHPLAFAWLAHAAFKALRARQPHPSLQPYWWTFAGAITYGAATEIIQTFVERQPSLVDFGNDVLGAAVALLLHARTEHPQVTRRRGFTTAAALLALVAAAPLALTLTAYAHRQISAPVLWQPDSRLFAHFALHATGDQQRLMLLEPLPDWRRWSYLEVDISNPGSAVHPIIVRVHDRRHDQRHEDRYNGRFELAPGSRQTLRIPLEQVRTAPASRKLDMGAIRGVVVFSVARSPEARFEITRLRLTGS